MKEKFTQLLNNHRFTPEEQFLKDKIVTANVIMLVMASSMLLFTMVRLLKGDYIQSLFDALLFVIVLLGYFYLRRDKKNLLPVARVLIFFSLIIDFVVIIRFEDVDTRFIWLSLMTYMFFYILGVREGKRWFIAILSVVSALTYLDIIHLTLLELLMLVVGNSLLAFFLIQYESVKEQSEDFMLHHAQRLNDTVEKKTAELKEQKNIFESLFQKSYDGTLLIENQKFIKCNDAVLTILGYATAKELLGTDLSELSPEYQFDGRRSDEKADEMIEVCLDKGAHNFEWLHKKVDGESFWCDVTLTHLVVEERELIHYVLRDISEKKALELENREMYVNLEEKVKKRTEQLRQAMDAKDDFLANMSHEIRTPLNAILGFIDVLKKEEHDPERVRHFEVIQSSSHSLLTIINDILDFAKIESGKLEIEEKAFALKESLENIFFLFKSKAEEKNISLVLTLLSPLPERVIGDVVRVKQIASNILSNAIKFTPQNGRIAMLLSYNAKKDMFQCSIRDNGVGIEKKNLSKVFNSFVQEDSSTTRKFGGTGLGLSISNNLVKLMHGSIEVESEIGKGTTFTFEIQLKVDKSVREIISIEETNYSFNPHSKILVVEDNKTNQMLMTFLLDDLGLECEMAENGQEAVDKVQRESYDLILMDENMPILNGIEATIRIRALGIQTPIIAVTANALKGDREKFLDAGMQEYLSKPIDVKALERVLGEYLQSED